MTSRNIPPGSVGEYAQKAKIPADQLVVCGLEKQQPELNKGRQPVKLPPWLFNNVHGMNMDAAVKRFQELSAELLVILRRQDEEESSPPPPKGADKISREQVFIKFKETPCSLQIHVKKVVTMDPTRKPEPRPPGAK